MKDKILMLIIGILIGAVITAGCFLLFSKNNNGRENMGERPDMGNFIPGDMPNGGKNGTMNSGNTLPSGTSTTVENTTSNT